MGEGGRACRTTDDFARPVGDERRTARLVLMQDEVPRPHRKGLEDRQELAFTSYAIERAMKPLDMLKGDGHVFDLLSQSHRMLVVLGLV